MATIPPLESLSRYLERWRSRKFPDEWEVFWDYKCATRRNGRSVADEDLAAETSARLISYLFMFGMGRGLLKCGSSWRFSEVMGSLRTRAAIELFSMSFEDVKWSGPPFITVWDELGKALSKVCVGPTDLMRTKILMAVWGQMPALDEFFAATFKATFHMPWSGGPAGVLPELRKRYLSAWKSEIVSAPQSWRKTLCGKNDIPHIRLIDFAFWTHGNPQSQ